MKTCFTVVLLSLVGLAAIAGAEIGLRVRVTYEVVDEEGKPVADAVVYSNPSLEQRAREGRTDANGRYTEEVRTLDRVGIVVSKEGYYRSGIGIDDLWRMVPPGVEVRRRFPDVTVRGVLRPIVNPVPMYAYKFSDELPVEDEEVGFDFLKAGWVKPYGRGEVADMLIRIKTQNPEDIDKLRGEIHIRFPNPGDGMVRISKQEGYPHSMFMFPRIAPETGYIATWVERWNTKQPERYETQPEGEPLHEVSYFIRIRTQLNEKGEIQRAMYGRIGMGWGDYRGFVWGPGSRKVKWGGGYEDNKGGVRFVYYVNPDGTRNMEYDRKRNLFEGKLRPQERTNLDVWYP